MRYAATARLNHRNAADADTTIAFTIEHDGDSGLVDATAPASTDLLAPLPGRVSTRFRNYVLFERVKPVSRTT